jgi:hypothetical protein
MAAASTLIDRIMRGFRRHDNPDTLSILLDSASLTLNYSGILTGWGPGTIVEIGSEILLVTEVDTSNRVASVVRGYLGTTPGEYSVNTPIYLNPRVFRSEVLDLINDALEDMVGKDLYQVTSTEITYDPELIGYPIPSTALDIIRVDGLKDDRALYWEPVHDWFTVDNADTGDFSTGRAIMMRVSMPPGAFRVIYTTAFSQLTQESQDLESHCGLRPYMTDLPFYYAMNRLMVDLERRRSQVESAQSHQRAQDVPPFLALRTGEWYQARYEDRIRICRARLRQEFKHTKATGFGS